MAVHALGQCIQLLAHIARHIAAVLRPQRLIALEQLGRIERQAAFAQRQRPQQIGRAADRCAHAVQIGRLLRGRTHAVRQFVEQVVDILAFFGRDRHDRHTQPPLELRHVDLHALGAHIIHEPERHHHRQAERDELQG